MPDTAACMKGMNMTLRTKIVATIGPASNSRDMLEKLVLAGMNVARLNFSHGNYETHTEAIRNIRSISRMLNRPVGILLDLQGPKIRVGKLENGEPVRLKRSADFAITTKVLTGTVEMVSTTYENLPADVQPGDTILLDDGLIRLRVESSNQDTVFCKVRNGGYLKENKGINLPGVIVSAPSLTPKDIRDVNFGIKNGVDYFALSFVRTAEDLMTIKSIMKKQGVSRSPVPAISAMSNRYTPGGPLAPGGDHHFRPTPRIISVSVFSISKTGSTPRMMMWRKFANGSNTFLEEKSPSPMKRKVRPREPRST